MKVPQMIGYVRKSEGNTTISFKINDRKLSKKYNQIWKKVEKLLKIEFDSKPVYGDIYGGSLNKSFQGKKIPRKKAPCKSLSIIILNSVVNAKKKCYPQTLLEECKYELKKIKMENLIDDHLEKSSSDESDNDCNNETEPEDDNDESSE